MVWKFKCIVLVQKKEKKGKEKKRKEKRKKEEIYKNILNRYFYLILNEELHGEKDRNYGKKEIKKDDGFNTVALL